MKWHELEPGDFLQDEVRGTNDFTLLSYNHETLEVQWLCYSTSEIVDGEMETPSEEITPCYTVIRGDRVLQQGYDTGMR